MKGLDLPEGGATMPRPSPPAPAGTGRKVWVAHSDATTFGWAFTPTAAEADYVTVHYPVELDEAMNLAYDPVTIPADTWKASVFGGGRLVVDKFLTGWLSALYTFYRGPEAP